MGGFFGAVSSGRSVVLDVFFGTDYHSHLGTQSAGLTFWDDEKGFSRELHNISNSPFRTKFEYDLYKFAGRCGIGCISDTDPQPLLIRSQLGSYAITTTGIINNAEELIEDIFGQDHNQFQMMSSGGVNVTELASALINQGKTFAEGIRNAQDRIKGSMSFILMTDKGELIAARDKLGRTPVHIGKRDDGFCVSFESFAYEKLGYHDFKELGPGEAVKLTWDKIEVIDEPRKDMKICAFLWSYYGYPNSDYEGVNVELMRYHNGEIMAQTEIDRGTLPDVDYVAGVPDSGIPHAIGYSTRSRKTFARPFVKYTPTWPRSFMPNDQTVRNRVAKMKQLPVDRLIRGKKLLFVDDSIVRGTQLRETVDFLYESGAREVHMRSACPPIMFTCKYLNFSRGYSDQELLARRKIREIEGEEGEKHIAEYADAGTQRGQCLLRSICEDFGFDSLGYQSLNGLLEAIGIEKDKVCTYCWTGKE
jgi:amidophosphoribosyltransferase